LKQLKPLSSFKSEKDNPLKVRRLKKYLGKLFPIVLIIAIFCILAIFLTTFSGSSSVVSYIFSGNNLKSANNRVNILLLGIAGGTHDGRDLTDTIMIASYNLKTNQVYLFSIPRDLWLPSQKSKANAVYETGLAQNNGLGLAKIIFGNVLGIPIHYALRVDFRGFVEAVDALGGIDIMVDKTFDDYNYPIEGKENDLCGYEEKEIDVSEEQSKQLGLEVGKQKVFMAPDGNIASNSAQEDLGAKYFTCRYEHITFTKGKTHLDGQTALKFVRSRHGTNGEGSDFARSKRQQKIIEGLRDKILSIETLANPQKIADLIKALGKSMDTDISVKDGVEFYKLSKKMDKTYNFVLDDSQKSGLPNNMTSLLIHPPASQYSGAYVLISQDDDFSTVQGYVKKVLTGEITEYEATASSRNR
jgi:anionic cell wall polymer biosynthesis LytR-Cps2A-Psr (LCP) family protein